mmetsp:Transcript_71537/g.205229  ORF Transcript_71537/g.205229 Transcript_71537/m.205229 type:complete len:661 (+) Transcript_71537:67-2049(+)
MAPSERRPSVRALGPSGDTCGPILLRRCLLWGAALALAHQALWRDAFVAQWYRSGPSARPLLVRRRSAVLLPELTTLEAAVAAGNGTEAKLLYRRVKKSWPVEQRELLFSSVLQAYIRGQDWTGAAKWSRKMRQKKMPVADEDFALLVSTAAQGGRLASWLELGDEEGVHLNAEKYNMVITAFAESGDIKTADAWLQKMARDGFELDPHVMRLMALQCAEKGAARRAEFYAGMLVGQNCALDLEVFHALLGAHSSKANTTRTLYWMARLQRSGLGPTPSAYTYVIDAFAGSGDVDQAESWLSKMRKAGFEPSGDAYGAVVKARVAAGDLEGARSRFLELRAVGHAFPESALSTLIVEHARRGEVDEAESWFKEIENQGLNASRASYEALLGLYAASANVERTEEWLRAMIDAGVKPGPADYDAMVQVHLLRYINSFQKQSEQSEQSPEVEPNAKADVIEAWVETDKPPETSPSQTCSYAERWLQKMTSKLFVPSLATFKMMVAAFAETQDMQKLNQYFFLFQEWGRSPDVAVYTQILRICAARRPTDKKSAYWYFRDMSEKGLKPEPEALQALDEIMGEHGTNLLLHELGLLEQRPQNRAGLRGAHIKLDPVHTKYAFNEESEDGEEKKFVKYRRQHSRPRPSVQTRRYKTAAAHKAGGG